LLSVFYIVDVLMDLSLAEPRNHCSHCANILEVAKNAEFLIDSSAV
jgi:hypothetical protein